MASKGRLATVRVKGFEFTVVGLEKHGLERAFSDHQDVCRNKNGDAPKKEEEAKVGLAASRDDESEGLGFRV